MEGPSQAVTAEAGPVAAISGYTDSQETIVTTSSGEGVDWSGAETNGAAQSRWPPTASPPLFLYIIFPDESGLRVCICFAAYQSFQ